MQQLMPLLLDWLSRSPDPDEGLLGLRTLISGFRTPSQVVSAFRDSPDGAQRLCTLAGTSRLFSLGLVRHPELFEDLSSNEALVPSTPVLERLRYALNWRQESEKRHEGLLRLTRAEQLRIAAADALDYIDAKNAALRRTALAEAVLTLSLEDIDPQVPVALIAMGRLRFRTFIRK